MLDLLIVLVMIAAITVFPVMLAAKLVGARRSGFLSALLALFIQSVAALLVDQLVNEPLWNLLVLFVVGSLIYKFVLDTSFGKGMVISLFVVLIAVAVVFLAGTLLGESFTITTT